MATASSSIELRVPSDCVWELIGGFGSLPDWLPYIRQSELAEGGRTRYLVTLDGAIIIEQLIKFDEKARTYTYHILRAPFPVTNYFSTLEVSDSGEGSRVVWSGEFKPVGVSDTDASRIFQNIYDQGLKTLASHFVT
jgi:hypothetical protein